MSTSKTAASRSNLSPVEVGEKRGIDDDSSSNKKGKVLCCCGCKSFEINVSSNSNVDYRHYCYSAGSRKPVFAGFCLEGSTGDNFDVNSTDNICTKCFKES